MPFVQGRNEQALVHIASGYAKASRRRATLAVTASIGPGALNMVTGAGLATVNRLPVLLLPGDAYATRRQGPVLQQLQHPTEADTSVNDAFRPVAKFFDPFFSRTYSSFGRLKADVCTPRRASPAV